MHAINNCEKENESPNPDEKVSWNEVFQSMAFKTKPGYNGWYSKTNQDSYVVEKGFLNDLNNCFIGVFDGHGEYGHRVAQFIKQTIYDNIVSQVRVIQSKLSFCPNNEEHIKTVLKNAWLRTNEELNRKLMSQTDLSGSTGVGV